jgi:hypothetical protein
MIDLRIFLQSEYWVDTKGTGHLITSMSNEYRSNVIRLLLIRAQYLHWEILLLIPGKIHSAIMQRDSDLLNAILQKEIDLIDVGDSFDFIEKTPLMKRLRELVPNGPTLGDLLVEEIHKVEDE